MPRKRKPGHNPEFYRCGNPSCERGSLLSVKNYGSMYPGAEVPPDRIHVEVDPSMPGFGFMCPNCTHYTVVTRFKHEPKADV